MEFLNKLKFWQRSGGPKAELDATNNIYYDTTGYAYLRNGRVNSAEQAMRLTTVYSCVNLKSNIIASLPCELLKIDSEGNKSPDVSNSLYKVLRQSPNDWQTAFEYWKWNSMCRELRGFFISEIVRNGGRIIALIPCVCDTAEFRIDASGRITYRVTRVNDYLNGDMRKRELDKRDVFVNVGMTMDGVTPISPIAYNSDPLSMSREMNDHGWQLFRNQAMPTGLFTTKYKADEKKRKALSTAIKEQVGGSQRGSNMVIHGEVEYQRLSVSNEDAQYLETRQLTKEEICGIFGIPPHLIGNTKQAKGWSTLEQQDRELIKYHINPILESNEQSIRRCLITGDASQANFNTRNFTKGDISARTAFYEKMVQLGVMSANDIRRAEHMNKIDDPTADKYYISANLKDPYDDSARQLSIAEAAQKLYLAAGKIMSADETRAELNKLGATLTIPAPDDATSELQSYNTEETNETNTED